MARLTAGSPAPLFDTADFLDAPVSLKSLRGRRIMLSFYRYASCPLCNLRMHELIRNYPRLQPDIELVAVFQSPADSIRQYVGRQDAPFPVVADPERQLYARYGLESSWGGFFGSFLRSPLQPVKAMANGYLPGKVEGPMNALPADFLIDEKGVVQLAYYGRDIGDHLPLEQVLAFARGETAILPVRDASGREG